MMNDMKEIMTFRSGKSLFGVPIQNVLSIMGESDKLYCKAFRSKEALGILEYRGMPVAVIDLAIAGNIESDSEAKQNLVLKLEKFEADHNNWVDALESAIVDNQPFLLEKDARICEFGQWLNAFSNDDEELQEIITEFQKPHDELHQAAKKIAALSQDSEPSQKLEIVKSIRNTALNRLHSVFARAVSQLKSSIKPVFIYLTLDGTTPCAALRIDEIEDVQEVADDAFVAMNEMALPQVNDMKYIKGFLKLGEKGDCLLIDTEILTNHKDADISQAKSA